MQVSDSGPCLSDSFQHHGTLERKQLVNLQNMMGEKIDG